MMQQQYKIFPFAIMLCCIACDPKNNKQTKQTFQAQGRATIGYIRHELNDSFKTRTLSNGVQLELEQFTWIISDVEMHQCEQTKHTTSSFLISTAHAHVPDSATRLGAPFVEDLLSPPKKANIVGELAPPFGRYCMLYLIIAPADDDIINTTNIPTSQMEGYSLQLKGRYRTKDDQPWQNIDIKSKRNFVFKIAIEPNITISQKESGFILLDKQLNHTMFESVFADKPNAKQLETKLINALGAQLRLYKTPSSP